MPTSQAYSRPARLLRVASWVIAVVFALFLNMLGELVMRDLMYAPRGGPPALDQYTDARTDEPLRAAGREIDRQRAALTDKTETLNAGRDRAAQTYTAAKERLRNWLATRTVTGDESQDPALVARTRELDALQGAVSNWQRQLDALNDQQRTLDARARDIDARLAASREAAEKRFDAASRSYELTVFGWRLAFTLPVLLAAVWLFVRYRRARYWPFVYGFGLFALSAFFVELVPYLPTFGGYVRVGVGIALTVFAGIYVLRAFQRYAERKRLEMQQSQTERARSVAYEKAVGAFRKKLCPSCDKPWNLGGDNANYCIHCGLQLFKTCACGGRNFAFFPFCNSCGRPVGDSDAAGIEAQPAPAVAGPAPLPPVPPPAGPMGGAPA